MNDINKMPPKCHGCPYWERCESPYVCPTIDNKAKQSPQEQIEENVERRTLLDKKPAGERSEATQ